MTVTIELSKAMTVLLHERAAELHIPTDQLAARLLNEALLKEIITPLPVETEQPPTIEEIVASIQALPPNPKNFHPPKKTVAEILTQLAEDPSPEPEVSPDEWDRLWAEFELQQKALDRANDI